MNLGRERFHSPLPSPEKLMNKGIMDDGEG